MEDSKSSSKIEPHDLLQQVVNNPQLPWQMRLDASKALLPYTRKRMALENTHMHTHAIVTDERLRLLNDGELRDLITLVQKLTVPGPSTPGGETSEVQHD